MATFSTNQVRQLYVAKELKSPAVIATDNAGAIAVKADTAKTHLYFEYMGAGGMTRSDLINISSIMQAKATAADALAHKLARYELALDATVNGGEPVAGQDYILRIAFRNYIGLSEEDQLFKFGMVHAYAGMSASEFYKVLVLSLVKNFSRDVEQLLKFYISDGTTATEVTTSTKASDLTGTYTKIILEEAPQEWILGVFQQVPVNFTVQPVPVTVNGDERIWGTVTKVASVNTIADGHKIADLEYFCMGERGDVYRMVGFPNVIRTKYLVDPSLKYNTIDIHFAYVGSNESVQKSEKQLTLAIPAVGDTAATANKLTNDIIAAINTATGLTITALPTT